MKEMGMTEEADKLERFIDIYHPSKDQFRKIREAVFDPSVRHIDQYVERIMDEGKGD